MKKYLTISIKLFLLVLISNRVLGQAPVVQSIERSNPSSLQTQLNNMEFEVNFDKDVLFVDSADFSLNGTAVNTSIQSVTRVSGSRFFVDVLTTDTVTGTIGLDINGVDGTGSNNIIEDNSSIDQQSLAKLQITDSPIFGQSFTAGTTGNLVKITVRTGVGHSYNGNGTMELLLGNGYSGTILATENISVDPSHGEKTYVFSNPPAVSSGTVYTMRFNFPNAPSLSTAFSAQVGAGYNGGILYQASSFSHGDLYFKTYITSSPGLALGSTLPSTDESYQFLVCNVSTSIVVDQHADCSGQNAGATVTASNGNAPYTYTWGNGETTAAALNLTAGTASISIVDAFGCFAVGSIGIGIDCSMSVKGNGLRVLRNDTTPSTADHTFVGAISPGDSAQSIFTIVNDGSSTLNISNPIQITGTNAADFTIVQMPANSINPGDSSSFTIQFKANQLGSSNATVSIANSSSDANPYNFAIRAISSHNGFYFDGSNDHVEIADNNLFDFTNAFTIEAWVKPVNSGNHYTIASKFGNGSSNRSWAMLLLNNGTLELSMSSNGNSETYFGTAQTVTYGEWNHVVFRYNGSVMEAFINGIKDGNNNSTSMTLFNSSQPVIIGARDNGSKQLYFQGEMDEVRLWNIARTDQEIIENKNCQWDNPASTGLVAYYDFNQGIANGNNTVETSLIDRSSNGLNGNVMNAALTGNSSNWVVGVIDSVAITCASPLSFVISVDSTVSCNGFLDGGATATVIGGTTPYTYNWSNSATMASITGLAAGTYSVTITDATGLTDSSSVIITEPAAIVASVTLDSTVSCNGLSDGGTTANVAGGTAPYTYSWFANNNASFSATTVSITNIPAGQYSVNVTDADGCSASTASGIVTEPATPRDTIAIIACISYTWMSNGMTYNSSGIYSDTTMATNGCDSISSIDLTINLSTSTTLTVTNCDSYFWLQNGMTYTTTGMYNDTIPNAVGCDSVVTLDLTINNTRRDTTNVSACESYTWSVNGMTYNSSGIYSDTTMAINGCDSISSIDLMINLSTSTTLTVTNCDSYFWSQNGMTYTTTGMYNDTIPNVVGCDSVVTLDLTINNTLRDTTNVSACESYTWPVNGMTYNSSGMFNDTISNMAGCDSVVMLNLVIDTVNIGITQNGFLLTANQAGASYQWIDCSNGNVPIAGATSQSYAVTVNGDYAVEVISNSCTDTSSCITVLGVGLPNIVADKDEITIYPNPTRNLFTINVKRQLKNERLQIFNLDGRLLKEQLLLTPKEQIDISNLADGVYLIKYGNVVKKLIVTE